MDEKGNSRNAECVFNADVHSKENSNRTKCLLDDRRTRDLMLSSDNDKAGGECGGAPCIDQPQDSRDYGPTFFVV